MIGGFRTAAGAADDLGRFAMAAKKKSTTSRPVAKRAIKAKAPRSSRTGSPRKKSQAAARKGKAPTKPRPDLSIELEPLIAAWLGERAGSLGSSVNALLAERQAELQKAHSTELVALQTAHDERLRVHERERDAEQRDAELSGRRELAALERRSRDAVERAERDAETGLREAKAAVRELQRQLRTARAKTERVETRLHEQDVSQVQQQREEAADRLARVQLDHENEIATLEARIAELEQARESLSEAVGQIDFPARSSRRSRRLSH